MYQVSLFINTWSEAATAISIEDFFAMVRNGYWKVPVEGHRNCLAKDRKHDAQTIKDSMACVIPAGICKNGHAKNNLTSLSLALCIDIDHTDEQTKDIFVRACLLEYVLGAFISISGRGVKLFIRIDIDGVNDYPAIYEATAKLVSTVLGVENDGKPPFPERGDLKKALAGIPGYGQGNDSTRMFKVLLSHDPTHWRRKVLPQTDIQLTLSGHTHGMQFMLFGWSPSKFFYPEWKYMYREGERGLYVSLGIGGALIPFRFGAWPEINVITLHNK